MSPTEWLLGNDTGVSSKVICAVMTGSPGSAAGHFGADTPSDPDDFGRCYRLLQSFPLWRLRLDEVAHHFPKWGPMVAAWDELTLMYQRLCDENGRYTRACYERNKELAAQMFKRMQTLNDDGRRADGWVEDRPGSWRRGDRTRTQLGSNLSVEL